MDREEQMQQDVKEVREVLFSKGIDEALGPMNYLATKYVKEDKEVGREIGLMVSDWVMETCLKPDVEYECAFLRLIDKVDLNMTFDIVSDSTLATLKAIRENLPEELPSRDADRILMNAYNLLRDQFACDVFPRSLSESCMSALSLFCDIQDKVGSLTLNGPCRNWRVVETVTQLMVSINTRSAQLDPRNLAMGIAQPGNIRKAWSYVSEVFDRGVTECTTALILLIDMYVDEMFPIPVKDNRRPGRRAAVKKGRY